MSTVTQRTPDLLDAGVKEVALVPAGAVGGLSMFERLATDQNVPVEKLERLMALWERGEARTAEAAFNVAMSDAQAEIRPVAADASNPQTRSRYASYEALDRALRPIYTAHGFALSFNTGDAPQAEYVRVICDVTHRAGHAKPYKLDMPADGKGAKGGDVMTKTHATGSAMSYGMRYLLKMIFNVAVGEDDDDGNRASGKQEASTAPKGYDDWLTDMQSAADEGWTALSKAWDRSPIPLRAHLSETAPATLKAMKAKAKAVTARPS